MRKITKIETTKVELPTKKRVAAYARVSVERDRSVHSFSAQVSFYNNLIQKNPEWEFAGVYADLGISGTGTKKRNDFNRLIEDCENGKIDIILTKSISRFARNTVDLLETVRHLKELGIEVRFEKENINSLSGDGELMLSILASFAQEESMSISKNVKWCIRKKFEKGKPNGGLNIYGYRWINKQLVIEPDEAKVVKLIYDNYQKGISPETTGKYLTEKGIKAYNGGNFSPSSLRAILTNITYTGDLLLQKDYCPDPIKKGRKQNRGELPQYYVENDHEAIIPMKQFVEVQEEIKRRRELGIRANAAVNTTCFTSKVKCPLCGKSYRRSGKRQSKKKDEIYYSWICQTKSKLSSKVCDAKTIPEYELKFASKEVLGLEEFDSDTFDKEIEKVIVIGNDMLEYHFNDGRVVLKEWHSHARTRCWDSKRREEWGEEIKRRWKDGEYDKERKNNTCNS